MKYLLRRWYVYRYLSFATLMSLSIAGSAQNYKGLNEKVKLGTGKQKVSAIIKNLQEQTSYTVLYDPAVIAGLELTIPASSISLAGLLNLLDTQLPLDIDFSNKAIAFKKGTDPVKTVSKQATGIINGTVFNERNEPLSGVTVTVKPAGKSTTTKIDGTYQLRLETGSYTLQYSFVSYKATNVTNVTVVEGVNEPLVMTMFPASGNLQGVEVTSGVKKDGVNSLYVRQKNAGGITDGISAEQIVRSPDRSVGEVLKRVSGVATVDNKYVVVRGLSERYNGAMLNGQLMPSTELNRKNFSFDIIPSNIIDHVTVYKTITPDMNAEFGGGLVNVETIAIPTRNFLTVSAGASINNKTTGKPFRSLELEGREYWGLPSKHRNLFGKLGWKNTNDILANTEGLAGTGSQEGYHVTDPLVFANNWGIHQFDAPVSQNYQLSWGHVSHLKNENQLGFIVSGSYRNTFQTQDMRMSRDGFEATSDLNGKAIDGASFNGKQYGFTTNTGGLAGIGYNSRKHKITLQSLFINTLDQQLILGTGINSNDSKMMLGYYDNTQWTKLFQTQLEGSHALGNKGIKINWTGNYIRLDRQRPDNHNAKFYLPDSSLKANEFTVASGGESKGTEGAMRWWTRALENNLSWDASVSVPFRFNIGKVLLASTFKTGYAGWSKDRLFYVATSGSRSAGSIPAPLQDFYAPDAENLSIDFDKFTDDFHKTARLHAVYGMFDQKIASKWRLLWGLRAEYYNLNNVNQRLDKIIEQINSGRPVKLDASAMYSREKNWRLFPSGNLTYSLTPKMNLRLAYTESIIRPDLREMSYFREYDFELGGLYVSNEPIISSLLQNVDFRYEYYPGPGEVLSFSVFYKKFKNPLEIYGQQDINEYTLRNNKLAENRGIEVEIRKSFAFTRVPVIKNITLYGNTTILSARVKPMAIEFNRLDPSNPNKILPRETVGPWEKRPQAGASNYMINAGLLYDQGPVSFSLLYNYVSGRVFRTSQVYTQSLFEQPLEALDAQLAIYFLKRKAQLRLNVSNLLNKYNTIYRNTYDDGAVELGDKEAATKDLLYQKGKDRVNYESRPGRNISTTITYNF